MLRYWYILFSQFIQRDPAKPFAVHYCTLPNYIYGYLGSLYYYMYQQMLTFTAEARFRDCGGGFSRNSPLSHERSCFHSQSGSQPACNNYIPHFFLISKPPTKGSSNMGMNLLHLFKWFLAASNFLTFSNFYIGCKLNCNINLLIEFQWKFYF